MTSKNGTEKAEYSSSTEIPTSPLSPAASQPVPYAEHGPLIDHNIPQDDAIQAEPDLAWSRIRRFFREPFSEFMGVFIILMFGDGSVAQVVLSRGTKGSYQSINWGWG